MRRVGSSAFTSGASDSARPKNVTTAARLITAECRGAEGHRSEHRQDAYDREDDVRAKACLSEEHPQRKRSSGQDLKATDHAQRTFTPGRSSDTYPERDDQRIVDEPIPRVQQPFELSCWGLPCVQLESHRRTRELSVNARTVRGHGRPNRSDEIAAGFEQAIRDSDANVEAGSASRSFPMTADRRSSISRLSTWTIRSEDITCSATKKFAD